METIGFIISIIASIWVYNDAKKRGKSSSSAFWWALGTLLIWIIFLPIWLIKRPKSEDEIVYVNTPKLCSHCGKYYEGNPIYCPNCGTKL